VKVETINQQLSLVVLNSEQLDGNHRVQYSFDELGGTLGASEQDDWQLRDRLGVVMPGHARIEQHDGRFCLCDLSGQTYINGASSPIGRARKVHLEQGDELVVGPFRLKAYLGAVRVEPDLHQVLHNRPSEQLDDWLNGDATPASQADAGPQDLALDPLAALQQERQQSPLIDSRPSPRQGIAALFAEADASAPKHWTDRVPPTFTSAVSEDTMSQEYLDIPTIEGAGHDYQDLHNEASHVALTPLMRGLGQSLRAADSMQAHDMLEEMGRTLRALVEGLLLLQADQTALTDKHLRPIEDNPLRLGLGYDDTLALLFAEQQSPVHLAAPAAVAESLRNIRVHHVANQTAIKAALDSILHAFSPAALRSRFEHYRRTRKPDEMSEEAWSWIMYQHYYQELTSSRQQGFDKLFHQVYAQAYDKALREQQGLI
jgi:type VI secretion system protein ImpI